MVESKQQQQSLDSLKQPDDTTSPADEEDDYDEELDEVDDDDDDDDDGDDGGGEFRVEQRKQLSEPPKAEAQAKSETLAPESLPEKDFKSYLSASAHLLSEVPVDYALLRPLESPNFKDQVGKSHQQALESVISEAAQSQVQLHNEVTESPQCPTSSSELSPTSVTQSISSGPTNKKLSLVANTNSACTPEMVRQNSFNRRSILSSDGYNWRKYGQKQVKIPQGSRSYYRCTYSECHAKKIEFCDTSNHMIEITSKGEHSHEPPRRINCAKESRLALPAAPNSPIITSHTVRVLNDPDPSTSSREVIQETLVLPETKQQNCIGSNGTADADIKEEHVDEPEPKQRLKKGKTAYSGPLCKPGKKPKIVVHAAGDVGISGDGYRWRKYGQKMVKGNPHPRNYYRCTSAGCPVRKHVERAVDSTTALIITYKGVHDHDKPVPKKRHGPPSAPLVAATAPASMNTNSQFKDTERGPNNISPIQCSVDKGGVTSEAMDTGEEKAIESARTLLSIGFEIKQC